MFVMWMMYLVIVVYNLLDIHQSYMLFQVGAVEANPLMKYSIEVLGVLPGMIIPKAVLLFLLGVGLGLYIKKLRKGEVSI